MIRRVFTKLLGLLVLLLVLQTVATEEIYRLLAARSAPLPPAIAPVLLWSALVTLIVAVLLAAWVAGGVNARLRSVVAFARRLAEGDLDARLLSGPGDELAEMEMALNQTAVRLNQNFAETEGQRQELAAILNAMQEGVIAVSAEGAVLWFNPVMQRVAGAQIRVGRALVQSLRDPELLACVRGALERKEVCTGRSRSLAAGQIFEIVAGPLPRGGAIAVLHDVTRVESAEKTRREFIGNVSHELRTPLTSIQGYVETLLESPEIKPETRDEFLHVVLKNASRMNRLTEDLLALASIEGPDYKLSVHPVRAAKLIEEAIGAMNGVVKDSGVELESTGGPQETVLADPDAISQVFGNLIENALKYAASGKRIRVGASLKENEVEFFVQDFGPGVSSEHQERIFERLYRVDKARSRESGGTGLGLAIVKHIVQAHGGRVWIESELGAGAAFRFTLPLAQA